MKFLKKALGPIINAIMQPVNKIIHKRELPPLFSRLGPLPDSLKFLEMGCGRGYSFPVIIKYFNPEKIVAFDLDEKELEKAKKLRGKKGLENVEIVNLDATSLPFPGNSFDVVFVSAVLHHIKDWPRAISESFRVLTPGGYLILKEPLKRSFNVKPINPFYKWYDNPQGLFEEGELRQTLEDNGFRIVFWEYGGAYGKLLKCSIRGVCQKN
jgi:ubiquinone/menaquinone biosynthesis C-methylase UbiE